jgi:hypothetical protein
MVSSTPSGDAIPSLVASSITAAIPAAIPAGQPVAGRASSGGLSSLAVVGAIGLVLIALVVLVVLSRSLRRMAEPMAKQPKATPVPDAWAEAGRRLRPERETGDRRGPARGGTDEDPE